MIYSASSLVGKSVISIRLSSSIGQIEGILIDPNRLSVAGLWVKTNTQPQPLLLINEDVRQLTSQRAIIDDHNQLTEPTDLPKLEPILNANYVIPGKKIVADNRKIGVAVDFHFNNESYLVSHIVSRPAGLRKLRLSQETFERRQIKEIDDRQIVVDTGPQAQKVASLGPNPV